MLDQTVALNDVSWVELELDWLTIIVSCLSAQGPHAWQALPP